MDYKTRQRLTDQELKWYYQGKMLDDADEMGVYDEYLEWLRRNRSLDELHKLSDSFDDVLSAKGKTVLEAFKIEAYLDIKHKLSTKKLSKGAITLSDE